MKIFTYNDYIKCIHTLRLNAVFKLAEESTEYKLEENKKVDIINNLFKTILEDKNEMAEFINQFIKPKEKVESCNLIKFNIYHNTSKYKSKEPYLLYKEKNKDIYFVVEHQSKTDKTALFKLLNNCIDIMYDWSKSKKEEQETLYPIIVPIIIYTGEKKWNPSYKSKEKTISNCVIENYNINFKYNLIDINKFSQKYLFEQKNLISHSMFIVKSKDKKEIEKNIDIITKEIQSKIDLEKTRKSLINTLKDLKQM